MDIVVLIAGAFSTDSVGSSNDLLMEEGQIRPLVTRRPRLPVAAG